MHEATRKLSPGPWMELPGYSLAGFLQDRANPPLGAAAAASAARALQPRDPRHLPHTRRLAEACPAVKVGPQAELVCLALECRQQRDRRFDVAG